MLECYDLGIIVNVVYSSLYQDTKGCDNNNSTDIIPNKYSVMIKFYDSYSVG